jgi:Rod binding domain-containing protein
MANFAITSSIDPTVARILSGDNLAQPRLTASLNNGQANAKSDEAKIKESAQGFERILIRQIFTTARKTDLSGQDNSSATSAGYLQLMDDHWADLLSKTGSLGFGKKMAEQLISQMQAKQLIGQEKNAVLPGSDTAAKARSSNPAAQLYDKDNPPSLRRYSN